jgi:hypothetical protein
MDRLVEAGAHIGVLLDVSREPRVQEGNIVGWAAFQACRHIGHVIGNRLRTSVWSVRFVEQWRSLVGRVLSITGQ